MKNDDIILLAIEHTINGLKFNEDGLLRFAKLVAQHEREACAEVCKKHADVYAGLEQNPTAKSAWAACIDSRDAIRARGQA
jgi:hypothetical protein